jgi:hypothetical protein
MRSLDLALGLRKRRVAWRALRGRGGIAASASAARVISCGRGPGSRGPGAGGDKGAGGGAPSGLTAGRAAGAGDTHRPGGPRGRSRGRAQPAARTAGRTDRWGRNRSARAQGARRLGGRGTASIAPSTAPSLRPWARPAPARMSPRQAAPGHAAGAAARARGGCGTASAKKCSSLDLRGREALWEGDASRFGASRFGALSAPAAGSTPHRRACTHKATARRATDGGWARGRQGGAREIVPDVAGAGAGAACCLSERARCNARGSLRPPASGRGSWGLAVRGGWPSSASS